MYIDFKAVKARFLMKVTFFFLRQVVPPDDSFAQQYPPILSFFPEFSFDHALKDLEEISFKPR